MRILHYISHFSVAKDAFNSFMSSFRYERTLDKNPNSIPSLSSFIQLCNGFPPTVLVVRHTQILTFVHQLFTRCLQTDFLLMSLLQKLFKNWRIFGLTNSRAIRKCLSLLIFVKISNFLLIFMSILLTTFEN